MPVHDFALRIHRRPTRQVRLGAVTVGGDAPVTVQSMTKTDTRDAQATAAQIREIEEAGGDIVRVAVPDADAARALGPIVRSARIPVVADVHFDHRLAVAALEAGVAGLRINPGNIGGPAAVREVVRAARERRVPIRIGVNAGSLEKDVLGRFGGATPAALVESAMRHVRILEEADYREIKISVKASDVQRTVEAYRRLAAATDYPLHVGVTEAGTLLTGAVRSSVAIGLLLAEGIGDTIRVSLTDTPMREVKVGLDILRSLGLRAPGPSVISCPTCGRVEVDIVRLAMEIESELENHFRAHPGRPPPTVAVMGCMVNGPGEAREADIAIAGGKGKAALYVQGRHIRTVSEAEAVSAVMAEVRNWTGRR